MRNILITGGSRGIGAETVRAFCKNGDRVAFLYRESTEAAARLSAETGALGFVCDVSDPDAVDSAYALITEALGGAPEVLINNAGVSLSGLSRDTTNNDWRRVLDTNLSSAFYLARACQPAMIKQGFGRIINVGSVWGKVGASCEVAYSAAKAGLRGLTMALAKELGPSGITVNCVEPGLIATDMNACHSKETLSALADETPLCRLGTTKDVASCLLFLASDGASFITGQCLGVDGGFAVS